MKRWLRRLSKVFLGLCAFWALVHVIEDWRGKRAWEQWKQDQEARGVVYDRAALVRPPLPDSDNFAKAPLMEKVLGRDPGPIFPTSFRFEQPKIMVRPNWSTGHVLDLQPWMDANHTQDLAQTLAPTAPVLEELATAAQRPSCQFPPPVHAADDAGFHLLGFRMAARVLNTRALLYLRSGQSELALQDVLTELRLVRHLSSDPNLVTQFVQMANAGIVMQALWEGLETHAWNEAQLATLQGELARADELTPILAWRRDERISTYQFWLNLADHPLWDRKQPIGDNFKTLLGAALVPRGWLYQNMRTADDFSANAWFVSVDPGAHRVYPKKFEDIETWWSHRGHSPYSWFAAEIMGISTPALAAQIQRFAQRQVAFDEAQVVCALERYRLAHQTYPDSLEGLVPDYAVKLPNDLFTGQPLQYHRQGDSFQLYSIGWNEKDEGGSMGMDGQERDYKKGDWPWPHPVR